MTNVHWDEAVHYHAIGSTNKTKEVEWPNVTDPKAPVKHTFDLFITPDTDASANSMNVVINDDANPVQLDTGSASTVLSQTPDTAIISEGQLKTMQKTSAIFPALTCRMNHYGGGSTYTCPGRTKLSKGDMYVDLVVSTTPSGPNMSPPVDIMGVMPGTFENHASFIRQKNIVSYVLDFGDRLAHFSTTPLPPIKNAISIPAHPRQLINLCIMPLETVWHWEDNTSTTWTQYYDGTTIQSIEKETGKKGPKILICLDIGTTLDISSTEVGPSPQVENKICTAVSFTCPDASPLSTVNGQLSPQEYMTLVKSVKYGGRMMSPEEGGVELTNALDHMYRELLPSPQLADTLDQPSHEKTNRKSITFQLSRALQRTKTITIPTYAANSAGGSVLEIVIGLSAFVQSYSAMQVDFDPASKAPLAIRFGGERLMHVK